MPAEQSVDETLLERLRGGDRDALAALFQTYRDRLERLVKLYMDPRLTVRVDPADVLQETYLDAARQVDRYIANPAAAFYIWIRGLAINRLHNLHRTHLEADMRSLRRQVRLPANSSVALAKSLLSPGPSPSAVFAKQELQKTIQQVIAGLPPDDRDVILMRHFEGLSNNEIAQAIGISASGATMRYGRALERLKNSLQLSITGESRP